jgi:hypothetical protein
MEVFDPIVPTSAQVVYEAIQKDELYHIQIILLGPAGDKVEEWEIVDAKLSEVNFGKVDWSSTDPLFITLTFNYDYAKLLY